MKSRFSSVYEYTVDKNQAGVKVHEYLSQYHNYSSRTCRYIIKNGRLLVNGKDVFFTYLLSEGDVIKLFFPEEKADAKAVDMEIDVLHEDEDIVVVNKGPDMVVHVTRSHPEDTLQNALYCRWESRNESFKTRFVNRLDMDTSGIVLVAKNKYVHHFIQSQNREGKIEKSYLLICEGVFEETSGRFDFPIKREENHALKRVVSPDGKHCVTEFEVLRQFERHALVKARILTGRTHQIRVHFSHAGHPIIGDNLYNDSPDKYSLIGRQALHAHTLAFDHPRKGRVSFTADLPEDFERTVEMLKTEQNS